LLKESVQLCNAIFRFLKPLLPVIRHVPMRLGLRRGNVTLRFKICNPQQQCRPLLPR